MDIKLYKNSSVENKINKEITVVRTFTNAVVTEGYNDYEISVRFTIPSAWMKWSEVNYMSVDGAYYFIESVTHENDGIGVVNGRMDLLMTYKDAIMELRVLAERSYSHGSTRLEDEHRPMAVEPTREVIPWPYAINEEEAAGCYILTTSQEGFDPA